MAIYLSKMAATMVGPRLIWLNYYARIALIIGS